jgi:hypothetical protein
MFADQTPSEAAVEAVFDEEALRVAVRKAVGGVTRRMERLAGDASSRQFFRVWIERGEEAGERSDGTVIAIQYGEPFLLDSSSSERLRDWCRYRPDGRVTFANDPVCHVELTATFAAGDVPVPALIGVAADAGLVIVEDIGDGLLQHWLTSVGEADRRRAYDRAVDLLEAIRGVGGCVAGTAAAELAFDAEKLEWELGFFLDACFGRFLRMAIPDESAVRSDCRELARRLAERPRVLCHRDYHARNILVRDGVGDVGERLVLIDFQDARMGPVSYDLVSLLEDPYVPLEQGLREALAERFSATLRRSGPWAGEEDFRYEYDLMAVQRLVKALGTYTYQAAVRGNEVYLPYIPRAVRETRLVLERTGRFTALGRALEALGH